MGTDVIAAAGRCRLSAAIALFFSQRDTNLIVVSPLGILSRSDTVCDHYHEDGPKQR